MIWRARDFRKGEGWAAIPGGTVLGRASVSTFLSGLKLSSPSVNWDLEGHQRVKVVP